MTQTHSTTPATLAETIILSDPTTETPELTPEQMKARIIALEAEVKANQLRGKQEKIDQPDGTQKTVADSSADIKREIEGWYLTVEQSRRQREELASAQPQFKYESPALCPTAEGAEKLLGRQKYSAMTPLQRAQVRDVRQSDLDNLNPRDFFGKGSSSLKAHELGQANPALYQLLKQKAVREGIF